MEQELDRLEKLQWLHVQGHCQYSSQGWYIPITTHGRPVCVTNGETRLTKLDLAYAYQQVSLDEESKNLVAVNTYKELYQYHRLPFGVSYAPSIFQSIMENILCDSLMSVSTSMTILITGKIETDHLEKLDKVMQTGWCWIEKQVQPSSVEYPKHSISAEGLHPTKESPCNPRCSSTAECDTTAFIS